MWCGKLIQKRILSLLSDRSTFLAVLGGSLLLVVSFLSFGEAWLQWSSDKYAAIFNSFSDNLAGRSLQKRLCQHVPIDVVYTWVNGSDPLLQDGLKHVKERLRKHSSPRSFTKCTYENCVPSHFFTTDHQLPHKTRVEMVRSQNPFLSRELVDIKDQSLICVTGRHDEEEEENEYGKTNRTFLIMESVEVAMSVRKANITQIGVGVETLDITHAHWTTEWTVPNAFAIPDHLMLTKLPPTATQEKLLQVLPEKIAEKVGRVHMYRDHHLAVLQVLDTDLVSEFLKEHDNIPLENGASILVFPAYLIVSFPKYANEDASAANRFKDQEELRYSLRSLEKYAPWIRHVYLVTNGQIPHWLNLDHPRLTVVTHQEIFENRSHLPTFSSPAIESNIYRIPGLSDKFLYFNDDVFLGEEVWPNDFYDAPYGQKIYFSWPLPDCAPGCPNSWIKDGYCDLVCNSTECMQDGGDCVGPNIKMGFTGDVNSNFHWNDSVSDQPPCVPNCLDPWLSDGFCDESCNVAECGYDLGDCGYTKYVNLYEAPKISIESNDKKKEGNFSCHLPRGVTVAFWDLSDLIGRLEDVAIVPHEQSAVRAASLQNVNHFLSLMLYPNVTETIVSVTLQGRAKSGGHAVMFHIYVRCDTTNHIAALEPEFDASEDFEIPVEIERAQGNDFSLDLSKVDETKLNVTKDVLQSLQVLEEQLRNEELTLKGFNIKKTALLRSSVRRFLANGGRLESLYEPSYDEERLEPIIVNENGAGQRKLMDVYGESMIHVNRIYTERYGYANRMAISHVPHLVDKQIFHEMKQKFWKNWEATSSHQLRQSDDMQFAFSYFHFLINEKRDFDIHKVFKFYDTDGTGTWSDREIRTLLTRIHSLPLGLEHINAFEKAVVECAHNLTEHGIELPIPKGVNLMYERYYDSKLPVVSEFLVVNCGPLVAYLNYSMRNEHKYKHTIVEADRLSAFRTITSNISQVVAMLDDLRKEPKKFLCLNDNTDPNEEYTNKMVHAVLVDYLESVLPVPSSFELPQDYRNKFLHTFELQRWQLYRSILTVITYLCVMLLVTIVIAGYFKIDIDAKVSLLARKLAQTLSPLGHRNNYNTV